MCGEERVSSPFLKTYNNLKGVRQYGQKASEVKKTSEDKSPTSIIYHDYSVYDLHVHILLLATTWLDYGFSEF